MTVLRPHDLRVDGNASPAMADPGSRPWLSWAPPAVGHDRAQVVVSCGEEQIWDSGWIPAPLGGIVYDGTPLRARRELTWNVRTASASIESRWSQPARLRTGLGPSDWRAHWIAHPVDAGHRHVRHIHHDHVAPLQPGHSLGQEFLTPGPFTSVAVHLSSDRRKGLHCRLEVCSSRGEVVMSRRIDNLPGDRFSHWVTSHHPLPAGRYVVRVLDASDHGIGWHSDSGVPEILPDDGLSPRPVIGCALADGAPVAGTRTMGVETVPAPAPVFRTWFRVHGPVRNARLYLTGLGYVRCTVDGKAIADAVLDPAQTDYDHRLLYRAHGIDQFLADGSHEIVLETGRGFWAARGTHEWGWWLAPWHKEPMARAQLEWCDADGEHILGTDATWEAAPGPWVSDQLYIGETYDQGRAVASRHTAWQLAVRATGPSGTPRLALHPPVTRGEPVQPKADRTLPGGIVYDFDALMAGWVRSRIEGPDRAVAEFSYAETVDADGDAACASVHSAAERIQIDRFITDGRPAVRWEPAFSYKGFRYARVAADPGVHVTDVEAVPVTTSVRQAGRFVCDNEVMNWVDDAAARTFLNNLHGVPTDTPVYEKNGWTADGHLFAESAVHAFDLQSYLRKWLDDHADSQDQDGTVPQIVPTPGWGRAMDPAWSASYPLLTWNLYREYGDLGVVDQHMAGILRYLHAAHRVMKNTRWLWAEHSWGDWLAPGYDFAPEGGGPTATMMVLHATVRAAEMCAAINRPSDAASLLSVADNIAYAYHSEYFDENSGTYRSRAAGYRQVMNVLPLAFDAVPAQARSAVVAGLVHHVRTVSHQHLDVGAVGAKYLLPVLTAAGHHELALAVFMQPTRPGWRVWKESGSTTLSESWDEDSRSLSHYFLGSVTKWIHEDVAGVVSVGPGWSAIDIRVRPQSTVSRIEFCHRTRRGTIEVQRVDGPDASELSITVPASSTARVLTGCRDAANRALTVHRTLGPGTHPVTIDHAPHGRAGNQTAEPSTINNSGSP
jgi:alpha-L-rhamnosidase